MTGLFQPFGWRMIGARGSAAALEFLRASEAAVAICEEELCDGAWRGVAARLRSLPDAPVLIVAGGAGLLRSEVTAAGGFDVLRLPLREPAVVATVTRAWRHWQKRMHDRQKGGSRWTGG